MEVTPSSESRLRQRKRIRSRSVRRLFAGLNAGTAIALLFILMVMVNYLANRHYTRFHLGQERFHHLSEKTVSLLESLPGSLEITVFIQPGHEIYGAVYHDVIHLLREYEYAANHAIKTRRIDPDRNLSQAEKIMADYGLNEPNAVIFEFGERRMIVQADELLDVQPAASVNTDTRERITFRGEQAFTSAILALTANERPRVYFLQGHGERSFDERDEYKGFSSIGKLIRRDDIDLKAFSFTDQNSIPEDAHAVIIAGPSRPYATSELERIDAFVNRAGRLILMLNAETDAGFAPLLNSWGIESANNVVVDPTRTLSGYDLLVSEYTEHPVTEGLRDITTLFYWPRALPLSLERPASVRAADEFKASTLALSTPNSWAEHSLEQRPYLFDMDSDIRGPLPIAVAVEKGTEKSLAMDIRPTRIVVFGDADFISNSGLSGGNSAMFMNALNWVLEREELIAISTRPVEEIKLMISGAQLTRLFITVVIAIPAVTALAGVIVLWRRRY